MKTTIFTSCYNQGAFLSEAIESVLNQTHTDFEYLLYNDGSTDNTANIMRQYAERDSRIKFTDLKKQKNIATVLNMSINDMSSAAWVWVPSDDIIMPNLVEEKLKVYNEDSIILSWGQLINEQGNIFGNVTYRFNSSKKFRERIWERCFIGMTGVMIPKNVFNIVGEFPAHYNFSEDYYWVLKSTKFDVNYKYIAKFLYQKRHHRNRITDRNIAKILENIPVIQKEIKDLYGN